MKKTFTLISLLFVFAFFVNPVTAQKSGGFLPASFGPAPTNTTSSFIPPGTPTNIANPGSRAFDYDGAGPFQLEKQSLSNTTLTAVGATVAFGFPGAAAWNYANGKLYVIDQAAPFALYTVDTLTGVRTFVANCTGVPQNNFTGLTWDPVTGNMYGVSSTIAVSQIFTVNITTGVCTPIGSATAVCPAAIQINAAPSGTLFSVDIVNDALYKWNKTTGVPTLIGPVGFNANFGQDAAFDLSDGQYYWAAFNATTFTAQLRVIDTLTGGSSLTGTYTTAQVATMGIYTSLLPIQATTSALTAENCSPANGVIDPNETVTISFCLKNTSTTNTTNLVGTLLPTGGVTVPSGPQSYGVVVAGGADVCRSFTFTANATCGGSIVASIQLQDGATNIGTITYNFVTGTVSTTYTENFDAVTAPALPAGWVATNLAGGAPLWVTSSAASTSAPNSIFVDDPGAITDKVIETPSIPISSASAVLSFKNNYTLENGFDGGVLEISINAAAYQDIITAGGTFTSGGYNGTISTAFGSTIGGRQAWTGTAGSFITSSVRLPAAANGQNVKFRFRMGSDNSVAATGWRIDDVTISQPSCCAGCLPPTVATQPANLTVCPTGTATFTVVGGGSSPFTYQWEESLTGTGGPWATITNGGIYSGATSATLTITGVPNTMNGYAYRVTITGQCGSPVTSNGALLTVIAATNGGTVTPASTNACTVPNSGTLTLSGYAGNIIRWESSTVGAAGPYTPVSPANTSTTLTYTNITNTTWYRVVIQAPGCVAVTSTVAVVNGNPQVVIVADPGTVLCEGDPALLTVVLGTSTPLGTLYTQGTNPAANGSPSQVFEPANANFTSQSADDFVVPAGANWSITQVTAGGIGNGVPTSVNVFIYANTASNLPGAAVASYPNVTTFVNAGGVYTVTLPTTLNLTGGTYWLSVQVNMSFATGGQWFWGNFGTTNIGSEYAWQNPGGGFGTPCASWGYGSTGCNVGGGVNRNNVFSLIGTSIVGGGALPAGYTFLWSPAAGLSSTTTNPVAASPMNTTTYTVTVTTPAGCTRTASILMTVNKRPTVTVQPAPRTSCEGSIATFAITATGTNLVYQWQVSTAGPAGPWTNLANGVPYSGVNTNTLQINPVALSMNNNNYRCVVTGICAPIGTANISNPALFKVNGLPVITVTPASGCGGVPGNGLLLSTGSSAPPIPGSVTVNSGTINVPIPEGAFPNPPATAGSNTIAVAGVPAGATITGISVKTNITHAYVGDVVMVLKAPNGQILNLDAVLTFTNNPGANFVNTVISSAGTTALSAGTAPFTNTYKADAAGATFTFAGFTLAGGPVGFTPTTNAWSNLYSTPNGNWTIAAYDAGAPDVGNFTSWEIRIDYTTPGGGGNPITYTWSPAAGLFMDQQTTIPYVLGTQTPSVYAAPTAFTIYTVTGTDGTTGCQNSAQALINYTPPAPTVTPSSVAMCLGGPSVKLKSSSSSSASAQFCSGPISVVIPDANLAGSSSNLTVSGLPPACPVSAMSVTLNMNHTWDGDVTYVLKSPNGAILNLDYFISGTGAGPTTGFVNTTISSTGTAALSSATSPYTGTFKADAAIGTPALGPSGPTGFAPTVTTWAPLYTNPNGTWTLAMYDGFGGDQGTLTSWCLNFTYVCGVPSTPATWSPITGLWNDSLQTIPYAGTPRDSVWTRPTPAGVYNYQVTVQSLPIPPMVFSNPAPITINDAAAATPSPANLVVSGLPTSGTAVQNVSINGFSHTWSGDVNIVLQSPTGQNVILKGNSAGGDPFVAATNVNLVFSDAAAGSLPTTSPMASGTYKPTNYNPSPFSFLAPGPANVVTPVFPASPLLSTFTGNMNGTWKLYVEDRVGGDAGNISGGYSIGFLLTAPPCTSPARTVVVTVNAPTTVATQPVSQVICTDKVATFTVVAGGSGPFSYQWQVSTDGGNTWANIANGGVYSGATTATLTITAPPVSMNNNQYRAVITGAAPCASATSFQAKLTVNPLPTIVISASPYTSLFPGLRTTLSSTVSPVAALNYTWLRNGAPVSGANSGTLAVNVDGLGDYTLRVTDVNNCTNVSNLITIKDSATGKCFIYPNPSSGQFQVRYYSVAGSVLPRTLTVYDAKGGRVITQYYTIGRPYDRMDVDMRKYGKGLYWVEIGDMNGNRLTMCRLVIE